MGSSFGATYEIVEDKDGLSSFNFSGRFILPNSVLNTVDKDLENPVLKLGYKGSLEDDMNQLFESINFNTAGMSPSQQLGTAASRNTNPLGKNIASKKPAGPRSQGAGTSELKQALRDLCISKASETAAMKRGSESGRMKNLYGSVLVESKNRPGIYVDESRALMVEILGESKDNHSENASKQPQNSPRFVVEATQREGNGIMMTQKGNVSVYRNHGNQEIDMDTLQKAKNVYVTSESHPNSEDEAFSLEKTIPTLTRSLNENMSVRKVRLLQMAPASTTVTGKRVGKLTRNVSKPMLRNKVSVKKKVKQSLYPVNVYDEVDGFYDPSTKHLLCHRCHSALKNSSKEEADRNLQTRSESLNLAVEKVITEDGWAKLNPGVKRYITEKLNQEFSGWESHDPVMKKDIAKELNHDLSGFDISTPGVEKIMAEESDQDLGGSENSNPDLKKDITEEINEDFSGMGSLILGVRNFGAEETNHTSSSSHVVSGVLSSGGETSQDSLASFFVDNSRGIVDCVNSDLEDHTCKEANKNSLIPANHSDEICSEHSESSARTSLDDIVQGTIEKANKGKLSQGLTDSVEKFTGSTSNSEINRLSFGNRPHMSKDLRWDAIRHVRSQQGVLGLKHFNLLKKLGGGDIGTVYLAELIGTNSLFAIKVLDNEYLERRNKTLRAQTEREILKMLDHPFLPTLYGHFTSDDLSCLVMEYCPGGDLHVLRQKQPARCFPEPAARFYVAEVLLALEYLHMLGVIYRDLKPENILVREDGHIMVTDFDLSLRWSVSPTLYSDPIRLSSHIAHSSCIDPFCIQPSLRVPSFIPRLLPATKKSKSKKKKSKPKKQELLSRLRSLPQLVAEPTDARSNSFVGTHEYLAPEIIKGDGHGASVDWWTFGILLYELLYGKTPFNGSTDDETLANVVLQNLKFPDKPVVSFQAKDLIRGLLAKEPENRVGSVKGATDIKRHPFFEGLNWALIRCAIPPELPDAYEYEVSDLVSDGKSSFVECKAAEEHIEFELF